MFTLKENNVKMFFKVSLKASSSSTVVSCLMGNGGSVLFVLLWQRAAIRENTHTHTV